MELIIADENGKELGYWNAEKNLDLDLGDTNDFEIRLDLINWDSSHLNYGTLIYIPGTEYGGIVGDIQTLTKSNSVVIRGDTWRGLMTKKIIEPPAGKDYLVLSGELNAIIRQLVGSQFGGLFSISSINTGVNLTNYQFERHCTLLYGIEKMLASVGHRIAIQYIQGDYAEPGYVELQAVPVQNYADTTEFSQDCKVHFTVRDYRRGINHLICLGKGELKDRTVLHLYVQKDGSIGKSKYYTGLDERVAIYDYSSVEDIKQLEEDGNKRLKELMNYKECEVTVDDVSLEIGDIVSGRDYVTGIEVQKPIVGKILKIDGSKETIEYTIKGDD